MKKYEVFSGGDRYEQEGDYFTTGCGFVEFYKRNNEFQDIVGYDPVRRVYETRNTPDERLAVYPVGAIVRKIT